MRTKLHFDIFDFSLAVFFFAVLASGGLSFSTDVYTVGDTQAALVREPLLLAATYQGYSDDSYFGTQTQTYGTYGNTGFSAGNTGSPADNVGVSKDKEDVSGSDSKSLPVRKTVETNAVSIQVQDAEDKVGAMIDYPYYKKTERWVFKCREGTTCNSLQSKWTEEKTGESTKGKFIKGLVSEIPGIGLAVGLSSQNQKSSKKTIEVYQPWYAADKGGYGITKKTTDHTYKIIRNPIAILPGGKDFLSEEGKISEVTEGPRGFRKTTPTNDAPNIEILHQKGEGKVTVRSENVTEELSIKEESEAFLYLYSKISGNQLKELVKEMPVALAKDAADYGMAMIPGGFVINKIGITGAITDKMEKVITRYPTYLVPLSVQVFELIPNPSPPYAVWEIEEKPVPCGSITVAKKKLDSNCRVAIPMDKKHMVKNITPEVPKDKAAYYRYEIALAGPIKQAQAHISPHAAVIYSLLGRPLENSTDEEIVIDENGFVVVPWWDNEDLPIVSPTAPYEGRAASSEQTAKELVSTETPTPTPIPALTTPPPGLWQRIVNFFTGGEAKPPATAAKTPVRKSVIPPTATTTAMATTTATTPTRFATSTQNATSTASQLFSTTTATIATTTASQTATTTISFANSAFVKPQTVAVGATTTIGGFSVYVAGEPVSVKNFRFRVTIGGGPGSLSDLKGVGLYGPTGDLVSEGVEQSDETILFTKTFTILTGPNTYLIKSVLGSRFKTGQTIQLYGNFYKDDVIFTGTKSGKNIVASKNTLNLSQMKVAALTPAVSTNVLVLEEQKLHDLLSPILNSDRWLISGEKFFKQFYQMYADDYDFIALFATKPLRTSYSNVINREIEGIGAYKIASPEIKKLKTIAVQNFYPNWESSPNFDDRFLTKTLIHEIGHHWLAFMKGLPASGDDVHWPNNLDLFSGDSRYVDPLAYYQWVIKNNQEICVDVNSNSSIIKFSNLSLYLMGLIPKEQVFPIFVHEFEKKSSSDWFYNLWGPQCEQTHKFTKTKTLTIEDIISANGIRNPSYKESQKNFRIAFVIVSDKGSVVPSGFIDYVKKYADALPKAWGEMTGGKSQMSVALFP